MIRQLGLLMTGALAFWVAAYGLTWFFWPEQRHANLLCSLLALTLCLIPSLGTLLWTGWGFKQSPDQQLMAALGGTGFRMFFVLGAGLLLTLASVFVRQHALNFWMWVLVLYLFTLALEIILLVRWQSALEASGHEPSVK